MSQIRNDVRSAVRAIVACPEEHREFLTARLVDSLLEEAGRPLGRAERFLALAEQFASVLRQYAWVAISLVLPGTFLWLMIRGYQDGNLDFVAGVITSGTFGALVGGLSTRLLSRRDARR